MIKRSLFSVKRIRYILIILIIVLATNSNQVFGAKTVTKSVEVVGSWGLSSYPVPPSSYEYNDGRYAGTISLKDFTIENMETTGSHFGGVLSNSSLEGDVMNYKYDFERFLRDFYGYKYNDPQVTSASWRGAMKDDGPYQGRNGKDYDYSRNYVCYFTYRQFRYRATYEGTVTSLNLQPEMRSARIVTPKSEYSNQDTLLLQVAIRDEDIGDKVFVKAKVAIGSDDSTSTLTSITANGSEQIFTINMQLPQLEGDGNIFIYANDGKEDSNHIQIPVKLINVLSEANKDIIKYVDVEKNKDLRITVLNSEDDIKTSTINDSYVSEIKSNLNVRGTDIYTVGTDTTKDYLVGQMSTADTYALNDGNEEEKIVDYILKRSIEFTGDSISVFCVGETIKNNIIFEDLENDYQDIKVVDKIKLDLPTALKKPRDGKYRVKYKHNPSVFDYPELVHIKDDDTYHEVSYTVDDPFLIKEATKEMRGRWTIFVNADDVTGGSFYDKAADEKEQDFIIHQRPEAILTKYMEDSADKFFYSAEESYDLDYMISKPDRGIKAYEWRYQLEDDSWHELGYSTKRVEVDKVVGGMDVVNISLTVTDWNGAKDTAIGSLVPPLLQEPKADIIIDPPSIYVGEYGSDRLDITNNSYPKSVIDSYTFDFDFASTLNKLDKTKHTIVNATDVTFEKNTLKTDDIDVFKRFVEYGIAYTMPEHPKRPGFSSSDSVTKDIEFIPVSIIDYDSQSIDKENATTTVTIKNSNDIDHSVYATLDGVEYVLDHIGDGKWRRAFNISGVDWVYIRIENKSDDSIIYDRGEYPTNRAPEIQIRSVTPRYLYEGDDLSVDIRVNDPDLDTLEMSIEVYKDGDLINTINQTVEPIGDSYDIINVDTIVRCSVGQYMIKAIVQDPFLETDNDTYRINSHPLHIDGFVTHTSNWNSNRRSYNSSNPGNERNPDVFWSGERFILSSDTTEIEEESDVVALEVSCEIVGTPYSSRLISTSTDKWEGELWEEDMLKRWQKKRQALTFLFTVVYSNGTTKTDSVVITVDDLVKYWELHRKF